MALQPADTNNLPDQLNQPLRPQFDGGARAIQRFVVNNVDLTAGMEAFAADVGRRLNHNLPLRAFVKNVKFYDVQADQPAQRLGMRWSESIFVYGYTSVVAAVQFDAESPLRPDPTYPFFDFRDFVEAYVTDSSNQVMTLSESRQGTQALAGGIPLSEWTGKGGFVNQVLATGYSAGSEMNFSVAPVSGCGITRVGFVSITAHYVRLPFF